MFFQVNFLTHASQLTQSITTGHTFLPLFLVIHILWQFPVSPLFIQISPLFEDPTPNSIPILQVSNLSFSPTSSCNCSDSDTWVRIQLLQRFLFVCLYVCFLNLTWTHRNKEDSILCVIVSYHRIFWNAFYIWHFSQTIFKDQVKTTFEAI